MGLSRRQFTKEFKPAAVRRLEQGVSLGEVARALEVNPNVLHLWRRELRRGPGNAFPGNGKQRWSEGRIAAALWRRWSSNKRWRHPALMQVDDDRAFTQRAPWGGKRCACDRSSQVILGIAVSTRKMWTGEPVDGLDLNRGSSQ